MAKVHIFDVEAANAQGYRWRWQSPDGTAASVRDFDFFYDCMADARANGHEARLATRQIPHSEQQLEDNADPPSASSPGVNRRSLS